MPLPSPPPRPWRETAILAAALCALKLALLGVDPTVRYFLGDSASYLHSALTGWIPPDRSFLYGWILRVSAVATHQIMAVTLLQSLFGVATACLVFAIARCDLGLGRRASAGLALLLAIEPAQLFYERMLMAESAGTLCLIAMIAAGLAWLRRPHWLWPGLWALAGILAVALRMSLLPVVLGFALLPPLVAWLAGHPAAPRRRLAAHLALAALATLCAHKAYQHLYGRLAPSRPDYIADSGYFRLGLVAPLVTPAQVARVGLPPDLLLKGATTKVILREAMRGIVPDKILDRKDKLAYAPPQRQWNHGPLRPWILAMLQRAAGRTGIFSAEAVKDVQARFEAGGDDTLAWRIASTEAWFGAVVERAPGAPAAGAERTPISW